MAARLITCSLALLVSACTPTPPPALGQAEVQDFVRQYVAATNAADAQKMMGLVNRDQMVSSIGYGKIHRGWDAIRTATDESIAAAARVKVAVGTIDVTSLGPDAALAVASMNLSGLQQVGRAYVVDVPGALTIVVKRTPDGLRLIHEHYSVRPL